MKGISELARLYGVSARAVRLYEAEGLITPKRDRHNWRQYDVALQERLALIAEFRTAGVSIEDIRDILAFDDADKEDQASCALEKLSSRLNRLEHTRQHVEKMISSIVARGLTPLSANRPPSASARLTRSASPEQWPTDVPVDPG